jgi:hypothetical protein
MTHKHSTSQPPLSCLTKVDNSALANGIISTNSVMSTNAGMLTMLNKQMISIHSRTVYKVERPRHALISLHFTTRYIVC